jgi:hypothetical protein
LFAPRSVLRELLKSAQAAECGIKRKRNFPNKPPRGESVVRELIERNGGIVCQKKML